MFKHIVLFNVKKELADQKSEIKAELKARLEALPALIDVIKEFEVGLNLIESDRSFDVALISGFDSKEALGVYSTHPKHLEALVYIRSVCEKTAATDYEN